MQLDSKEKKSRITPDVWSCYSSAQTLYRNGREIEAAQLYRCLIDEQEDFIWGHFGLGEVYLKQQQFKAAAEQFSKVTARQPMARWAHYQLGISYEKLREYSDAIAAYETAAALFEKANQFKQAIATCQKITALKPNDAFSYYKLARLLAREDDWRAAASAYEKAIQLGHPHAAQAYRNLITLLKRQCSNA